VSSSPAGWAGNLDGVVVDVVLPVSSSVVMTAHGPLFGVVPCALLSLVGRVAFPLAAFANRPPRRAAVTRFVTARVRVQRLRLAGQHRRCGEPGAVGVETARPATCQEPDPAHPAHRTGRRARQPLRPADPAPPGPMPGSTRSPPRSPQCAPCQHRQTDPQRRLRRAHDQRASRNQYQPVISFDATRPAPGSKKLPAVPARWPFAAADPSRLCRRGWRSLHHR
jgi:hypothetical protein